MKFNPDMIPRKACSHRAQETAKRLRERTPATPLFTPLDDEGVVVISWVGGR